MFKGARVLCFIPARGGSKGIPNKNIVKLGGKPLIAYTIEAALRSGICDKVMVSTNSSKISSVAVNAGAEVPYLRPDDLATDTANVMDAIQNVMEFYTSRGETFDLFLYMQPTSPFRNHHHVLEAFQVFEAKGADVVASVNPAKSTYQRMNVLKDNGSMAEFVPRKKRVVNRQELRPYYELNGAIHIAKWNVLKKERYWYVDKSYAYILNSPFYLDIDEPMDLEYAEFLLAKGVVKVA